MAGGRRQAPPVLGLTGGIGSGKSEALRAFAELGAATLSSDDAVHAAYARPEVVERVRARFGDAVIGPDGSVNRALLGPRAFAEEGGLAALEAIVHPLVGRAREEWIARAGGRRPAAAAAGVRGAAALRGRPRRACSTPSWW